MATVARRVPFVPRPVFLLAIVTVLGLAYLGFAAAKQQDTGVHTAGPSDDASAIALDDARRPGTNVARSGRATLDEPQDVFAQVDGLALGLPHPAALAVAFHEASQPEALSLEPIGRLIRNDNPERFDPPADAAGPEYAVLASRGRGRPATSSVDIVVPLDGAVVAPVTGTVVEVRQYALYGRLKDWRVVIEPEARPDLHVVMIHLHQPQVQVGERVEAERTAVGVARLLGFASQVDELLDGEHPHVHLEVKAATRPAPPDPHEPAVEPEDQLDG